MQKVGITKIHRKNKKVRRLNRYNNFTNLEDAIKFTYQWFNGHKKYLK